MDLREITSMNNNPWMVVGAFNCVLNTDERVGSLVTSRETVDFRRCVFDCGLSDLKGVGQFYTWSNKQQGVDRVFCKLDRALIGGNWYEKFPDSELRFIPEGSFDHTPMVTRFLHDAQNQRRPFRYFRIWRELEGFDQAINDIWSGQVISFKMYAIVTKLKATKKAIKALNRESMNIQVQDTKALKGLMECQQQLQTYIHNTDLRIQEQRATEKYKRIHKQYVEYLRQNARAAWIKDGDDNTRLFHQYIKQRRIQNNVYNICAKEGNWVDKPDIIHKAFLEYYLQLLGTTMENRKSDVQEIMDLGSYVENEDHEGLVTPVIPEEVKQAMFSIPGDKSPRSDGFGSHFFRDNWEQIGDQVTQAVISFFHSGKILNEINVTVLALIPKCKVPNSVVDFRPIACCNVIYKVISKILCMRLNTVLPKIVADNQGAFIEGRNIVNNIMICHDLLKGYGRKGCRPSCMIKIDMRKA